MNKNSFDKIFKDINEVLSSYIEKKEKHLKAYAGNMDTAETKAEYAYFTGLLKESDENVDDLMSIRRLVNMKLEELRSELREGIGNLMKKSISPCNACELNYKLAEGCFCASKNEFLKNERYDKALDEVLNLIGGEDEGN